MGSNGAYRIGFVIEQALGHVTHGQNLQANVPKDPSVEAYWSFPAWDAPGLVGKVPNWTVRAGLQACRDVAKMQRQTQLDALFFHTQVTAVFSQNWLRRIPSIISLDATPLQYDALGEHYAHNSGPDWLEHWKWRLNRDSFRAAQKIVTWSYWAKQGLVDEYEVPPEKIIVIPPGVNTAQWVRQEPWPAQDEAIKILFVGANLKRKGGSRLLEAFRLLRERNLAYVAGLKTNQLPDIELHLVTKDAVPAEPGVYVYNDMQPNSKSLKRLYHDCDIFCLPTQGDCLPMVLSEAGAAGMPLVSTRVAAIPEIVREGETGFLIPSGDVAEMTAVLHRLITNTELRRRLGARAAEVVEQEFDADYNARRLLELLKQTVDEARTERKS